MRDFIRQTGQNRDYFREQNYPKENIQKDLIFSNINGKIENDENLNSALTINAYKVLYGHTTEYWLRKNAHNCEKEIFANIFNLEAQNNDSDIEFLQACFPEVWESYVQVRNNGLNQIIKESTENVGNET